MSITAEQIVEFWFEEEVQKKWFNSTAEFDKQLKNRFEQLYENAAQGKLDAWKNAPVGALALCIILDQFPLNMYRDQEKSFATEAAARDIAHHAIEQGFDRELDNEHRLFLYLPFMHSENADDQDFSVKLFSDAGIDTRFAEHHREIVRRFGRFPHRNEALGRECTAEERAYLESDEAFHG